MDREKMGGVRSGEGWGFEPQFCQSNVYCYDLPSRHKKGTFAFTSGFIE